MMEQGDGTENEEFREGAFEIESEFAEPITIKRFSGTFTTPAEPGQAPDPIYASYSARAVMVTLSQTASLMEAGVLTAGDITLQMRDRLHESDANIGGSHPGDRVIWRGAEYRMVQRPEPVYIGGDTFWNVYLRRVNPNTDVAGL